MHERYNFLVPYENFSENRISILALLQIHQSSWYSFLNITLPCTDCCVLLCEVSMKRINLSIIICDLTHHHVFDKSSRYNHDIIHRYAWLNWMVEVILIFSYIHRLTQNDDTAMIVMLALELSALSHYIWYITSIEFSFHFW